MKLRFSHTICLVLFIFASVSMAQAQLRIGLNGVEFGPKEQAEERLKKPVQVSSVVMVQTKPKRAFGIGRSSLSTIPAVEVGWNVLSNVGYGAPYEGHGDFLDINNWKSTQVTVNLLNFTAYSHSHKVGATIGLGVRANNYHLGSNLSLRKEGGVVMPYDIAEVSSRAVKKSKFNIASVHIPVELIFGNPSKFAFSVGGYVDMVMNSHTKIKYKGGNKDKEHNFPVNFIQAGATARLSFRWFSIYASYQPTQLFKQGRGPEAQQWTIGIGF